MFRPFRDALAFRGRLTRLGYWRWQLALLVISAGIAYGSVALVLGGAPRWMGFIAFAPMAVALAASIGVTVRRLHDRARSALWLLVFMGGPWLLGAAALLIERAAGTDPSAAWAVLGLSLAALAVQLWGFVEIGLLRGDPGPNRFGPAPE